MADAIHVSTTTSAPGASPLEPAPPPFSTEEEFVIHWQKDVERAARSAAAHAGLDRDEANDFAQEADIRLLATLRSGGGGADAYLRRVIANAVCSARRARFRWISRYVSHERRTAPSGHDERVGSDFDDFASPININPSEIVAVSQFIGELPPRLQEIYHLLYIEGFTQEEAAAKLGVTRQRITQLHSELLRRGRQHFDAISGRPN